MSDLLHPVGLCLLKSSL